MTDAKSPQDVVGGVVEEERALQHMRKDFNVERVFAVKGAGNFLSGVEVAIRDARGAGAEARPRRVK